MTGEDASGLLSRRQVTAANRTLSVLTAPADTGLLAMPAAPALARDAAGEPIVSLTLVLEHAPGAGEDIEPLVREGLFGLTLSLALPQWALDALAEEQGEVRPVFAREARFAIAAGEAEPLAKAEGAGAAPRVALSAVLEPDDARKALAALRGNASGLSACARVTFRAGTLVTTALSAPLEEVLGGGKLDLERHLRLVAPRGPAGTQADVPLRVPGVRAAPGGPTFAALGGKISLLATALHPAGPAPAQALAGASLGRLGTIVSNEGIVAVTAQPLPVVEDANAPLWPDRVDPRKRWYAPALELVRPTGTEDPAVSPFRFQWKQSGVTGGANAAPGLDSSVRFTLRTTVPDPVRTALQAAGNPPATPLPLSGLTVALEVPFRDEGTGATRTQLFPARVEISGQVVTATVDLLDGWVRLAYGALAYEGFQSSPARLRVAWPFQAYVPLPAAPQLAFGGKLATLPAKAAAGLALAGAAFVHGAPHVAIFARPELAVDPARLDELRRARYALRSMARTAALDALFPCKDNLTCYRQLQADGTDTAAGCQDALRLGAISYRQFDEIPELRRDDAAGRLCSVYRSLQQPGRYLIAPARFRIARYAPSAGADRAYRPAAMVYALRAPGDDATRYFISAQLEPDLPLQVRRELEREIAKRAPGGQPPVIDYPNEPSLQTAVAYHWAVPAQIAAPETSAQWDGFQVTVSAGLNDALLLTTAIEKGGISGDASFTFPDGLVLTAQLLLDTAYTGPWSTGPVEVNALGTQATLVNRVEVPVDVSDVVVDAAQGAPVVPVDAALAPGASLDVQLPAPANDPYPVATPRQQDLTLQETDVYVEDVTTSVVFINLVNYASHGIASLSLEARLRGTDHVYGVALAEQQHATLDLTLSLTSYLTSQTLEYRLLLTPQQGAQLTGDWRAWDLEAQGTVLSITPDLLPAGSKGAPRKEAPMKRAMKAMGPSGLSIHIGLNHVDPSAYDNWDGQLSGCLNDANAMRDIATAMGYQPINLLLDENATSSAVLQALGTAAQQLQAGDQLLLTYSGHGGQVPNDTGDEEDNLDETWVLFDRQLIDNELYAMWGKFQPGVRIFVLSDSCHSGTILRMRDFKALQQAAISARGLRGTAPAIRGIPLDKALKNYQDNKALYRNLQWVTRSTKSSDDAVQAAVMLISGCQDNQFSQDGAKNGLFTEKLLQVWSDGSFDGDHPAFHRAICDLMPPEQTPNYYKVGVNDADFEGMKPFVIGAERAEVTPAEGPSISAPATALAGAAAPVFQVNPSPYKYYAVEVVTDPSFFIGGSGTRTSANSYGSWSDVHLTKRGTEPQFTLPTAAWTALCKASRLYYRIWATQNQAAADWQPYQVAYGAAPIAITPSREVAMPPPPPAEIAPPGPRAHA